MQDFGKTATTKWLEVQRPQMVHFHYFRQARQSDTGEREGGREGRLTEYNWVLMMIADDGNLYVPTSTFLELRKCDDIKQIDIM